MGYNPTENGERVCFNCGAQGRAKNADASDTSQLRHVFFANHAKMIAIDSETDCIGQTLGASELGPQQECPKLKSFFADYA